MVQPGLPASRLLNLPQRPPTPPRESENSGIHTEPTKLQRSISNQLGDNTPPQNSPSSSLDSTQPSSGKSSKKVAWSAWNEYKDPPQKGSTLQSNLRQLPSSGELKPAKSILKPYNGVNAVDRRGSITKSAAPHTYPNFATMLESIIRQLAGDDRSSRIDAYLTLSGALKASENVPESHALKEKAGLLSQFIQRDISAKNSSGALDTGLITNALTLLACLIWKPTVADCFSIEFCSHIIEHSISTIRDPEAPKDVIKHLLFILSQQTFSPKTMISDRVRRLIEALGGIESQVKARSIVLGRIAVYRKLLRQARMSMLSNLCWVEDLFTDMTSSIKEVRTPAVALGFEASLQLGAEKQASRAIMDLFAKEQDEATYADYYKDSLISMIRQRLDGHLVPQIWSIVVLFMRARPHQLEHWEFITPWLQVIEKCFNSGDHEIKIQAYSAWNRFVFAVRLSESTTTPMIKFLGKALEVPLLKRKAVGRNAKETRQATIGSICNLLYYALRPDSTPAQLDLYWDEYIVQLVGNTLIFKDQETPKAEQENISQACEIIAALLDTTPKAWNNNRANTADSVKAEELPGIDAKWARKNAQRVFKVLGPLLEKCFRDLKLWEDSAILVWSRFISCVAAAGVKEVKVSNDTMSSMASIFDLLYKLWENGPRNLSSAGYNANIHFQRVFANLITTTTSTLGLLPFTEKLLLMGPQESFVIVATPSHSPFKARGEVKCPLHHLFILMTRPATETDCDIVYEGIVKDILNPFFEVRKTRCSQVELLIDLFQLLPFPNSTHRASNALWKVIASYATIVLNSKTTNGNSGSSSGSYGQPLGVEYRSFIKILEYGAMLVSSPSENWRNLFAALSDQVTLEAGESGRAIAVIEPLARIFGDSFVKNTSNPSLGYCPILLSKVVYPRDMQALDASRRILWGTSNTHPKHASLDPYSQLYIYTRHCLNESYKSLNAASSPAVVDLLSNVIEFISRCPTALSPSFLTNIQGGLSPWLLDEDVRLGSRSSAPLLHLITTLWTRICVLIEELPATDSNALRAFEPLLRSAFESRHRSIVSTTITLWNSTFGSQATLEYPPCILVALQRLKGIADLHLPSFPKIPEDEDVSAQPTFLDESQDDNVPYISMEIDSSRKSISGQRNARLLSSPLPEPGRSSSPQVMIEVPYSSSRKRPFDGTPEPTKRKVIKKDITPKLRHDNSQIQFTTIDSSPLGDAVLDSQLLTDRQREVKERQNETGTLFAYLRPSPGLKVQASLPKLGLDSELALAKQRSPHIPTTPVISKHDKAPYDTYINSSPTPRRGSVEMQMDSDAFEPPSSPPEAPFERAEGNMDTSSAATKKNDNNIEVQSRIEGTKRLASAIPIPASLTSTDLGPSAQVVDDAFYTSVIDSSTSESLLDGNASKLSAERPSTPIETTEDIFMEPQAARTPNEIFVDALSSPATPSPTRDVNSDDLYADALPSPLRTSVLEHATVVSYGTTAVINTPTNQQDLQTSFSFSEADEDSILRLITKFDGAAPLQIDSSMINEEDVIQSSLLSEVQAMSGPASVEKDNKSNSLRPKNLNARNTISPQPPRGSRSKTAKLELRKNKPAHITSRQTRSAATIPVIPGSPAVAAQMAGEETKRTKLDFVGGTEPSVMDVPHSTSSDANTEIYDSISITGRAEVETSFLGRDDYEHDTFPNSNHSSDQEKIGTRPLDVPSRKLSATNEILIASGPNNVDSGMASISLGSPLTGQKIVTNFEQIISALGCVALTRAEAQKVENLLWDVKGELYAAEKRGRMTPKSG